MSAPDWMPAVGDTVWVGDHGGSRGARVPYEVTQVGVDESTMLIVWLRAWAQWREEIIAVYLDGAWLAAGRWSMWATATGD